MPLIRFPDIYQRHQRPRVPSLTSIFPVEYFEFVQLYLRRVQISRGGSQCVNQTPLTSASSRISNRLRIGEEEGSLVSGSEATFVDLIACLGNTMIEGRICNWLGLGLQMLATQLLVSTFKGWQFLHHAL